MKRIKVLGIVIFTIFVVINLMDFTKGVRDSMNEDIEAIPSQVSDMDKSSAFSWTNVSVYQKKDKPLPQLDAVNPDGEKVSLPYAINDVAVPIYASEVWVGCSMLVTFVFALGFIYGFYCLIRMYISTCKGEILTRRNARRLRIFVYSMFALAVEVNVINYINYRMAVAQLSFENMGISGFHLKYEITDMLVLILLTEIFAFAVKLKEEQELTV